MSQNQVLLPSEDEKKEPEVHEIIKIFFCPRCIDKEGKGHPLLNKEFDSALYGDKVLTCVFCGHSVGIYGPERELYVCGCMQCQLKRNPKGAEDLLMLRERERIDALPERNRLKKILEKARSSPAVKKEKNEDPSIIELRNHIDKVLLSSKEVEKEKDEKEGEDPQVVAQRKRLNNGFFGSSDFKKFCGVEEKEKAEKKAEKKVEKNNKKKKKKRR